MRSAADTALGSVMTPTWVETRRRDKEHKHDRQRRRRRRRRRRIGLWTTFTPNDRGMTIRANLVRISSSHQSVTAVVRVTATPSHDKKVQLLLRLSFFLYFLYFFSFFVFYCFFCSFSSLRHHLRTMVKHPSTTNLDIFDHFLISSVSSSRAPSSSLPSLLNLLSFGIDHVVDEPFESLVSFRTRAISSDDLVRRRSDGYRWRSGHRR